MLLDRLSANEADQIAVCGNLNPVLRELGRAVAGTCSGMCKRAGKRDRPRQGSAAAYKCIEVGVAATARRSRGVHAGKAAPPA